MKKIILVLTFFAFGTYVYPQSPFGPKKSISTSTGSFPRMIEAAKINGDAYVDIVIGTDLGGTLEWYKNNGNGTFTKQTLITSTLPRIEGMVLADLDNDNDIDVIATSYTIGKAVWFQNNGSGGFGTEKLIASGLSSAGTVKAGDIDGNGTIDVAVSSYGTHKVSWFSNNGSGTFGGAQDISNLANTGPLDFDMADYDKDGDLDLVVAYGLIDAILIFDNALAQTGNPTFTYTIVDTANYGLTDVRFGDVDNNGDLEIIKADQYQNTAWYNKSGSSFTKTVFSTSNSSPTAIIVSDIDKDNSSDVLVGYSSTAATDKLTWYKNSSSSGEADIDASQNDIYGFALADFDNDGDLDMASVSSSQNHLNWFENTTLSGSLGIEDVNQIDLSIYPNPTNKTLYFKSSISEDVSLSVYDLLGKEVINSTLNLKQGLDVSKLNRGVYIITFKGYNTTFKFIKQ